MTNYNMINLDQLCIVQDTLNTLSKHLFNNNISLNVKDTWSDDKTLQCYMRVNNDRSRSLEQTETFINQLQIATRIIESFIYKGYKVDYNS